MLSVCVVNYTNDVTRFILHQICMCSHAMQGPFTCFMFRGGNRPGQALKGLSLVYDESLRLEPGL